MGLTSKEGPIRQDLGSYVLLYDSCATADEMHGHAGHFKHCHLQKVPLFFPHFKFDTRRSELQLREACTNRCETLKWKVKMSNCVEHGCDRVPGPQQVKSA